ncbi:MAG: M42 family peptidase [Anaerolineales bacterium]|jgi:endoglucanase
MDDAQLAAVLKDLLNEPGLSANEGPIRERLRQVWRPLLDEITVSRLGSLHGRKRGQGREPRPSILIAAHMDSVGLMVEQVVSGFLRVRPIGWLDPRILPGQPVTVHGRREVPGLLVPAPAALLDPQQGAEQAIRFEDLWVDLGLSASEAARLVRPGDLIAFAQLPFEMGDGLLAGKALDDRAGLAALTLCLMELRLRAHSWDVMVAATSGEEENLAGARTSSFEIHPDLAVAVDATLAAGPPGQPEHKVFPLGAGITLGWGPIIHPGLFRQFEQAARRAEVPFFTEVMPGRTQTDADALQVAVEGIPTMLVSIPLRYMHTPLEVVALRDIRRAGRLLAEFCASLDEGFLQRLTLE